MEPSRGRRAAPLLLLLLVGLPSTEASCLAGPRPGFTAAPSVKQRSLTSVRVNWEGLVSNLRCADQFRVKWSIEGTPDIVNESNLLSTDRFNYTVKNLEHNRNYVFQVTNAFYTALSPHGVLHRWWLGRTRVFWART
jgi:hypothetical protein